MASFRRTAAATGQLRDDCLCDPERSDLTIALATIRWPAPARQPARRALASDQTHCAWCRQLRGWSATIAVARVRWSFAFCDDAAPDPGNPRSDPSACLVDVDLWTLGGDSRRGERWNRAGGCQARIPAPGSVRSRRGAAPRSMSTEASLARIVIPTPSVDFDPSEVAVSWQVLTQAGHNVVFATPDGRMARGDEVMLTGEGLDPWGLAPGLRRAVLIGRFLRAGQDARDAYAQMADAGEFHAPIRWDEINLAAVDGVLLPGGHRARGMRRYLESELLQGTVVEAFGRGMPVAAICHGALLAARSTDPDTGRSVLYGRKTTSLTWSLERRAWQLARITRFWDRDYYRTYREQPGQPAGYMSVQA